MVNKYHKWTILYVEVLTSTTCMPGKSFFMFWIVILQVVLGCCSMFLLLNERSKCFSCKKTQKQNSQLSPNVNALGRMFLHGQPGLTPDVAVVSYGLSLCVILTR